MENLLISIYKYSKRAFYRIFGFNSEEVSSDDKEFQGHDARAIANRIIKANHKNLMAHYYYQDGTIAIETVIRFVYVAHGWTLGYTGKPLIKEKVYKGKYAGPKLRKLYAALDGQGCYVNKYLTNMRGEIISCDLNDEEQDILDGVISEYGKIHPIDLERQVKNKQSPNYQVRYLPSDIIPNEVIQEYYEGCVERVRAKDKKTTRKSPKLTVF